MAKFVTTKKMRTTMQAVLAVIQLEEYAEEYVPVLMDLAGGDDAAFFRAASTAMRVLETTTRNTTLARLRQDSAAVAHFAVPRSWH